MALPSLLLAITAVHLTLLELREDPTDRQSLSALVVGGALLVYETLLVFFPKFPLWLLNFYVSL